MKTQNAMGWNHFLMSSFWMVRYEISQQGLEFLLPRFDSVKTKEHDIGNTPSKTCEFELAPFLRFCQFSVNGCCLKFIVSLCSSSCNSILVVPNEWIVCSYLAYWYLAHWIQQSITKQQIPFFFSIFFSTKKQGTHQGSGNDIRIFRVPNLLSTWSNVTIMCRNDELS